MVDLCPASVLPSKLNAERSLRSQSPCGAQEPLRTLPAATRCERVRHVRWKRAYCQFAEADLVVPGPNTPSSSAGSSSTVLTVGATLDLAQGQSGRQRRDALNALARQVDRDIAGTKDPARVRAMSDAIKSLARVTR